MLPPSQVELYSNLPEPISLDAPALTLSLMQRQAPGGGGAAGAAAGGGVATSSSQLEMAGGSVPEPPGRGGMSAVPSFIRKASSLSGTAGECTAEWGEGDEGAGREVQ